MSGVVGPFTVLVLGGTAPGASALARALAEAPAAGEGEAPGVALRMVHAVHAGGPVGGAVGGAGAATRGAAGPEAWDVALLLEAGAEAGVAPGLPVVVARAHAEPALLRQALGHAAARGRAERALVEREARLRRLEDRFFHEAVHDPLTGLPNRELLLARLRHALRRAPRGPGRVAVLLLDLDHFERVNDGLGQAAGDRLLMEVAARLLGCLQPGETVARLGGDEFGVLLEDVPSSEEAARTAERLREALARPVALSGREVFLSASVGVACAIPGTGPGAPSAEDVLRDGATALHRAKARGRDRHAVYDATLHAEALARLELESSLRRALERGELRVHYQPIVALPSRSTVRLEALLRWEHPSRGLVLPGEFIPVLEETGLIVPTGLWVLEEACRQLVAWRRQGAFGGQPVRVSINVSARQFAQPDLVESVAAVLARTGAPPGGVALELTESVLMEDPAGAERMLHRLRALGVGLHLDDFGTGYSSLRYLQRFPLDMLKIDRSFVSGLGTRSGDGEIVRAIIGLARSLAIEVVAEGIETEAQLGWLQAVDCHYGQGYLFARPGGAGLPSAGPDLLAV
jgi:diguanylate cyclase (GGDEF)-like protein